MKLSVLIFFLLSFCSASFSQKPMSKEFIESKLDSLLMESNLLYDLVIKSNLVKMFVDSTQNIPPTESHTVNYIINDTLHTTVLSGVNIMGRFAHHTDTFINIEADSSFMETENFNIEARKLLIQNQRKNGANLKEGYYYEIFYIGKANAPRLYQLSATAKEDVVPFGGDFLYILREDGDIEEKKFMDFHPQYIKPNTSQIILIYKDDSKYIHPADIYKFRRFNTDENFTSFSAFSRYNKRMFRYVKETNDIMLKNAYEK